MTLFILIVLRIIILHEVVAQLFDMELLIVHYDWSLNSAFLNVICLYIKVKTFIQCLVLIITMTSNIMTRGTTQLIWFRLMSLSSINWLMWTLEVNFIFFKHWFRNSDESRNLFSMRRCHRMVNWFLLLLLLSSFQWLPHYWLCPDSISIYLLIRILFIQ